MNKKLFLLLLMASGLTAASAQVWVGGEMNYQMNSLHTNNSGTDTEHEFTFAPEVGIDLNEKWGVAAQLKFEHGYDGNHNLTNTFGIRPYVRYYWGHYDKWHILTDGGLDFSSTHVCGNDKNINSFGLFISPGVSYSLNDRFGLEAHFGHLDWTNRKVDDLKENNFNLFFDTEFFIGFYVNL